MEEPNYQLKLKSKTPEGTQIYEFKSSDGVTPKDSFREAELALADHVLPETGDNLLVVEAGYGFLGTLADQAYRGETLVGNTSDRAHQLTTINMEQNDIENATPVKLETYSDISKSFDKIVYAPEGYEPVDVIKHRIGELVGLLSENGQLFIAGKKTDGITRYSGFLKELGGNLKKIAQEGGQRVYRYTATGDEEPEAPDIQNSFSAEIDGTEIEFTAEDGLFSPDGLDEASRLLIENTEVEGGDKVLDLASGYGAVGIFLNKLDGAQVSFTDDSGIAIRYAKKNLESAGIRDAEVKHADCLDGFKDGEFDAIVSNPPTHQGSQVTDEMFRESFHALKEGGELFIVYNQNMRFEDDLERIFTDVEIVAEKDNFRVAKAVK